MENSKHMIRTLFGFLFILFSCTLIAGGGWPQKKGKGYYKLYEWWIIANQHYTDVGLIDPNVTTGIFNTTLYGEYGLSDRVTLIANAPLFSRSIVNNQVSVTTGETIMPGDAINGIGDVDIAVKYGLTSPGSRVALSGTLLFGLPLGIAEGGINQNLQTGDGEFNQLIQFDAGISLFYSESMSVYTNLYAGYNNRTNQFSDEVRFGGEIGVGLFQERFWLTGRWNGLTSMKNGTLASSINSTSIFANNSEYQSLSIGAAVYLTNQFGFAADYATAISGRIILARPSYSLGVFLHIK